MAEFSSIPPAHNIKHEDEHNKRYFRIDYSGMSASWRVVLGILATLFTGTGGFAAIHFATSSEVDIKIQSSIVPINKTLKDHDERINGNKSIMEKVQLVQHRDIAAREARRVTADIQSTDKRLTELERIRQINMDRLSQPNPKEPCSTVKCEN
jgi:hypothetical protein